MVVVVVVVVVYILECCLSNVDLNTSLDSERLPSNKQSSSVFSFLNEVRVKDMSRYALSTIYTIQYLHFHVFGLCQFYLRICQFR